MAQVSFFVPTLNSGKTIKKCLESLQKQTNKENIIVIDGGSKDKTLEFIKNSDIKIIKQSKKGLANARNLAIDDCKTKFIAFIDSDCYIEKDWSNIITKNFQNKKVAGACGCLIEKNIDSAPDRWRKFHLKQNWGTKKIEPIFLFGSNSIFRLSALRKIKGYNEKYLTNYEDVDISKRLKVRGFKLIYEPNAKAYHLKKDNLESILKTTRGWSFYSYPVPDSFKKLSFRIFIYNPYLFLNYLVREIRYLKLQLIMLNFIQLIYNQVYDINYLLKIKKN